MDFENSDRDDLLAAALAGDEAARGSLFEQYRDYLDLLARLEIGRQLQVKVDTGDLVQETFLDAHRNFGLFRGRTEVEFAGWLRTILAGKLSNVVRHYVGTQGRDIRREQSLQVNLNQSSVLLQQPLFATESSPSQQVMKREQGVLLANALKKLSPDYREIIILRNMEELPFDQCAQRMNRSVDAVQKLWIRALAQLRRSTKGML
jgi:RNA polymerase sigma-70 factor (ECF subfamily)